MFISIFGDFVLFFFLNVFDVTSVFFSSHLRKIFLLFYV
jgi:hypothetical protein